MLTSLAKKEIVELGLFSKSVTRDVATCETRATELQLAIASLEKELADANLEALTSGNFSKVDNLRIRLEEKKNHLVVAGLALEKARDAARTAEEQAQAKAKLEEAATRRRPLAQHCALLSKEAANFEAAVAQMVSAWKAMDQAATAAAANCDDPPADFCGLHNLAVDEIARQGAAVDGWGRKIFGAEHRSASDFEPLSKIIARAVREASKTKAAPVSKTQPQPCGEEARSAHETPSQTAQPLPPLSQAASEGSADDLRHPEGLPPAVVMSLLDKQHRLEPLAQPVDPHDRSWLGNPHERRGVR